MLEDRVFLAEGLLSLYRARPAEHAWGLAALDATEDLLARFGDPDGGCWAGETPLFVRRKEWADGAEPSGNGRLAEVLRQLVALGWDDRGALDRLIAAGAPAMTAQPVATPELWQVVHAVASPADRGPIALVIAGEWDDPRTQQLLRVWNRAWRPHGVVALADARSPRDRFTLLRDKHPGPDGRPLAYVCRNGRCDFPVASPEDLGRLL